MMHLQSYLTVWHVIYIAIVVPTVIGNGLIILSIVRYKFLRTKMHILIGNLAVSDLMVGLLLIPFDLVGDFVGLNHNKIYCISKLCLFVVSLGGSCCSLLFISIERLITIAYPFARRHLFTKRRLFILLIIGWIYVIGTSSPPLFGWNTYIENQTICDSDEIYTRGYQYWINIQFAVVLVCNIVLYAIVMKIAMKTAKCTQLRGGNIIHTRSEKDLQKVKMMMIILGIFIICWGSYAVIVIVLIFYDIPNVRMARKFALMPGVLNSALNWLVYGFTNKTFRTAFKAIVKCQSGTLSGSALSSRQSIAVVGTAIKPTVQHRHNMLKLAYI